MEIRATETERADAGATNAAGGLVPVREFCIDVERRTFEIDVRVLRITVKAGWEHLVVECQDCLEYSRGTRGTLEVPDVRLDGAQCDAARFGAGACEDVRQAFYLDDITNAR
jgi:hypothetical protein